MRRFLAKLKHLLRRRNAEADLQREVAAHLALLEDDFRSQGMNAEEARQAAHRSYGNIEVAKEQHRDERTFPWLEALWQDLRHAVRSLRKSPGFVAVALLSLAFGIGVNTAIFTLVNGILLKKLPVPDPDRVVQVKARVDGREGQSFISPGVSFPVFREIREQKTIFTDLVGTFPRPAEMTLDAEPQQIKSELVTGAYFQFFDLKPALGRLFGEEDDVEGVEIVCVLGYNAWHNYFGGDPNVLGRVIELNKVHMRVVGVAPLGFGGSVLQQQTDVWAPSIAFPTRDSSSYVWLQLLGRLQPGVTLEAASAQLESLSPVIQGTLGAGAANRNSTYLLSDGSSGLDMWKGQLQEPLVILMGAVLLVLLVACANLANLLLARMNDRSQEFAVKLSLGISRWRLLRQLFFETLLIAVAGGGAALLLSFGLLRFILDLFNDGNRFRTLEVAPDSAVFSYAAGCCFLTALIAGLYPAWQASGTRFSLGPVAKSVSGLRRSFARRTIIVVQVTLAVVLLFGSILFAKSLHNLRTVDLGFAADRLLTVELSRRDDAIAAANPDQSELLARARALPGVQSATLASPTVLSGGTTTAGFDVMNAAGEKVPIYNVYFFNVETDYFKTLQTPLLRGREFSASDRKGAPAVVIVNERLAERVWPGEDPVGKRITGSLAGNAEVIGVVANSNYAGIREESLPIAYRALAQFNQGTGSLQIRFDGSAGAIETEIPSLVDDVAPTYQVWRATTLEKQREGLLSQDRLLTFLSSLFGALGVGLALVGIYGLISYSVAQRTHEIGVRVSVGAQRSQIVRLVLSEAAVLLTLGVLAGLPLALSLSRWLESLLYEVAPSDPLHIAATLGLLAIGGAVAAYLPALRATRINPLQALRSD